MILITKSPDSDSRSSDPHKTSTEKLKQSTKSHIHDVEAGLNFLGALLKEKGFSHDHTKLENMAEFHDALKSGHVKETPWYEKHITEERHHLKSHVPEDVNLIDVLEHLTDCTMAGLTRSGEIYDTDINPDVLVLAAQNTVELLKRNTKIIEPNKDMIDENID